ncbi:hypothetical protein BSR28_07060 [Boudabousia liubingyangii]|uniref:acyltransferase family protein n=1 Tax=Boudabousia liubingyangii TaxID=1921764 RepID=UPI00093D58BE|nr:acyltransferase family protein [Boudabousia liubingyangii]OKL46291.1 hypothetical protein BSR28_07060 [Boudabousia liubingyangii]
MSNTRTNPYPRITGDQGGRIPGLDGLRALAIAAVLIYHLHPAALTGGFIGVDIFFVLSGFLISTLLLRHYQQFSNLNLANFWVRRARRLIPAVLTLVLVCTPIAALTNRDLLVGIRRQLAGALTFTTNWVEIFAGSSYFDRTSPIIYANLWSLGVEEQFYVLWPLILIALIWAGKTWQARAGLTGLMALLSATAMALLFVPGNDATRVYYGLDTHAFGLMIGAILAMAYTTRIHNPFPKLNPRVFGPTFIIIGLGVLMTLSVMLTEEGTATYRGGLLGASLAAALLIAGLLLMPKFSETIVDNPASVWIGQRSYGIYLWHWPVLLIAEQAWVVPDGTWKYWALRVLVVILCVVGADASFRWVETPMRRDGITYTLRALRAAPPKIWRPITLGVTTLTAFTLFAAATAPKLSAVGAQIEGEEQSKLTVVTDATAAAAQMEAAREAAAAKAKAEAEAKAKAQAELESQGIAKAYEAKGLADPTIPTGEEITALGDSLIVTSKDGLKEVFPGIAIHAKSNSQWKHAMGFLKQAQDAGELRRAVVVDFGTNAGLPDPAPLEELIKALGPKRQIVLVNIGSRSTFVPRTNEILNEVAAKYPNVIVADWATVAKENPKLLQSDRTHPNVKGATVMGETIKSAFEALSKKLQKAYDSQ